MAACWCTQRASAARKAHHGRCGSIASHHRRRTRRGRAIATNIYIYIYIPHLVRTPVHASRGSWRTSIPRCASDSIHKHTHHDRCKARGTVLEKSQPQPDVSKGATTPKPGTYADRRSTCSYYFYSSIRCVLAVAWPMVTPNHKQLTALVAIFSSLSYTIRILPGLFM